jgi:hypothetical protein
MATQHLCRRYLISNGLADPVYITPCCLAVVARNSRIDYWYQRTTFPLAGSYLQFIPLIWESTTSHRASVDWPVNRNVLWVCQLDRPESELGLSDDISNMNHHTSPIVCCQAQITIKMAEHQTFCFTDTAFVKQRRWTGRIIVNCCSFKEHQHALYLAKIKDFFKSIQSDRK